MRSCCTYHRTGGHRQVSCGGDRARGEHAEAAYNASALAAVTRLVLDARSRAVKGEHVARILGECSVLFHDLSAADKARAYEKVLEAL